MSSAEVNLTLYNAALVEKERCSVPALGHSTDRRAPGHVQEGFREDDIHVLICFCSLARNSPTTGMTSSVIQCGKATYPSEATRIHSTRSDVEIRKMQMQKKFGNIICQPSGSEIDLVALYPQTQACKTVVLNGFAEFAGGAAMIAFYVAQRMCRFQDNAVTTPPPYANIV